MARQVSGSDKTLIDAIRDGEVPQPILMSWNAWQAWRSRAGRMPRQATDGYTVSRAQEVALWKAVMNELYGEDWSIQLASMEDPAAAVETAAEGVEAVADASLPENVAAARPAVERTLSSPGSGFGTAPETPARAVFRPASSPGSGQITPSSWLSDNPGTPTGLRARVLRPFRPAVETLEAYTDRVRRQVAALELAEAPLAEGMLEHLLSRAGYEFMLYTRPGRFLHSGAFASQ